MKYKIVSSEGYVLVKPNENARLRYGNLPEAAMLFPSEGTVVIFEDKQAAEEKAAQLNRYKPHWTKLQVVLI